MRASKLARRPVPLRAAYAAVTDAGRDAADDPASEWITWTLHAVAERLLHEHNEPARPMPAREGDEVLIGLLRRRDPGTQACDRAILKVDDVSHRHGV